MLDSSTLQKLSAHFSKHGWFSLRKEDIYTESQWATIATSSALVHFENVSKTNESSSEYSARVGRVVIDGPTPLGDHASIDSSTTLVDFFPSLLTASLSDDACHILHHVTGIRAPTVARCQYNFLNPGDHIGYHSDRMKGLPYGVTIVIAIDDHFSGGRLLIQERTGRTASRTVSTGDIVIFDSALSHCVTRVGKGIRKTLCIFVSDNDATAVPINFSTNASRAEGTE